MYIGFTGFNFFVKPIHFFLDNSKIFECQIIKFSGMNCHSDYSFKCFQMIYSATMNTHHCNTWPLNNDIRHPIYSKTYLFVSFGRNYRCDDSIYGDYIMSQDFYSSILYFSEIYSLASKHKLVSLIASFDRINFLPCHNAAGD